MASQTLTAGSTATIAVRGASTHNLRDVDLDLPRNQLIVFCGASGSGKTSMAIDTLYAEGQRRYIESFSAYTRQFLDQLDKPDVERIDGLPPAIAVTRSAGGRSNRTTVATATEVADHLRLLFARLGETTCPDCDLPVRRDSIEAIATTIATALTEAKDGTKAMLGFEVSLSEEDTAAHVAELIEAGYVRAVVSGVTESLTPELLGRLAPEGTLTVIADRLTASKVDASRITESIEAVLEGGDGACVALVEEELEARGEGPGKKPSSLAPGPSPLTPVSIDGRTWRRLAFDTRFCCNQCGTDFRPPEPQLFNFNSPLGACELCEGFGSVVETDMDLVIPDPSKTLREGAVAPWTTPAYEHELKELLALADDYDLPVDIPYSELTKKHQRLIVEGVPEREFGGLNGFFKWLERRKYKMHLRVFLSRWRSYRPCEACDGARLSPEALAVRVGGLNFSQVCAMEVREASQWLKEKLGTRDEGREKKSSTGPSPLAPSPSSLIAQAILVDVQARLLYLEEVGVGYLTLDRTLRTLSTGETQRVGMTATLGSNLVDMLYVLDEPSAGLHPADVGALTRAITRLRDRGNTVIVVDHEEETIRAADELVEFGPQSGVEGGQIVYQGPPDEVIHCRMSRTGDWLAGRRAIRSQTSTRRTTDHGAISLKGATGANLTGLDVDFPLGVLTVVTGVSGAGKSSLVLRTLYPTLAERLQGKAGKAKDEADRPLPYSELLGSQQIDEVVLVDQQPIGRSPRSNPVTYIKAFDPIRALFAEQPDAQAHGFTASHFSFNVDGGRCEACKGAGLVEIDMQFLADIFMKCRECEGRRYRREVLEVLYRGRDISEVLDMTAHEAFRFFRGHKKVQAKLKSLIDVGLNYLQLGQPANTVSGGEAQRLKLAGRLATKQAARTLFILDEPTTGLHFSDVQQLIDCFGALLDVGHSLLVIEHNVPMMMGADWIIDLGPGAAADGGKIVVQGTPEKVAACKKSATGRALAEAFTRRDTAMAALEAEEAELEDE